MSRSVPTRRPTWITRTGFQHPPQTTLTGMVAEEPSDNAFEDSAQGSNAIDNSAPATHVKITAWRLLNIAALLGLGIFKAVSTDDGQSAAANTSDWILGIIVAFISYVGGFFEQDNPEVAPWLFKNDLSWVPRSALLGILSAFHWIAGVPSPAQPLTSDLAFGAINEALMYNIHGSVLVVCLVSFISVASWCSLGYGLWATWNLFPDPWVCMDLLQPVEWDITPMRLIITAGACILYVWILFREPSQFTEYIHHY
ncbi:hypothetical protein B0H14DRAFT_3148203 [Mycena olivaceomarginata]|nr:hypothetical protein B0H14DRAFT_3148203 [Mycena olivaceomarginata]